MRIVPSLVAFAIVGSASAAFFALTVPTEVQSPGTQQGEVVSLERSPNCLGCHGYYDPDVSPSDTWSGGMMAHSGRDPLFWAAVAIAEQDFDGVGDLCIRCHSPAGWLDNRSTPTDGSALLDQEDGGGVECMLCHRLVNPDGSEHLGTQNSPFEANTGGTNPEAYLGGGMFVLADTVDRYGPYDTTFTAPHGSQQSNYHRSSDLCGTCHDVSNPVVGDLAHNNGAMDDLPSGSFSGVLGAPVDDKAAFNNKPHAYGVVERTFSEHKASGFDEIAVSSFNTLPAPLQNGIMQTAYDAAQLAGLGGDFEDGTTRYYTCQTCHMRPVEARGSATASPIRKDMAVHDLTGGNTRVGDMIIDMDARGQLVLGSGLTQRDKANIDAAAERAREMLQGAAKLEVVGNTVKVYNLTGHKLTSGYPEGRRMWLNIRWFDANDNMIREDGKYGRLTVAYGGRTYQVESLLDLHDPNTKIYEVHGGLTQEWAAQLVSIGTDPNIPLSFDRITGAVQQTLGGLAVQPPGTTAESLHFALNNVVLSDNRIPPYNMDYDEALIRNCLPVPATQYGNPGPGGKFNYWDEFTMNPPAGADRATIRLVYQITSWEYLSFLFLANDGSVTHLKDTGKDLIRSWFRTGMARPEVMATATW
ncbi:MAG: hypothetical protein QF489_05260 [Planctomycetota bacterium]|nr:hypothetical protein [Planctomycetota bacterium]